MKLELPNGWMIAVNKAMIQVHERFKDDSKFILTESDLKCWLFYELQNQKTDVPYAVHTEVTHYAKHTNEKDKLEKKYKFRDLSLLCPWLIKDHKEIWSEENPEYTLTKGFKHKGPAIHFELKFIRQGNNLKSLESDITKLQNYHPETINPERRFVVVWGSRCTTNNFVALKTKFNNDIKQLKKNQNLIEFYLFDSKEIVHYSWNEGEWI